MNIIAFIKERARFYNCPACARNLENCEVRMLKQAESHLTVEVTCAKCHVTFIVVLAVQYAVDDDNAMMDEPALVDDRDPISTDEILDLHEALRGFDGNFRDLVKSSDPKAN